MQSTAKTPQAYVNSLPKERKAALTRLRKVVLQNLPKGFVEEMNYGMLGYVVPHSLYSKGYHCDPKLPLPFIGLASQKNFIAVYHMGIYSDPQLLAWFTQEYAKRSNAKLDMGKSCIRFKKMDQIPFELIGELAQKVTPQQWIKLYELNIRRSKS